LPGGTSFPVSKAFKNFGTKNEAVASDPVCKNSRRLMPLVPLNGELSFEVSLLLFDIFSTLPG
jgi:hypothetical protein